MFEFNSEFAVHVFGHVEFFGFDLRIAAGVVVIVVLLARRMIGRALATWFMRMLIAPSRVQSAARYLLVAASLRQCAYRIAAHFQNRQERGSSSRPTKSRRTP